MSLTNDIMRVKKRIYVLDCEGSKQVIKDLLSDLGVEGNVEKIHKELKAKYKNELDKLVAERDNFTQGSMGFGNENY